MLVTAVRWKSLIFVKRESEFLAFRLEEFIGFVAKVEAITAFIHRIPATATFTCMMLMLSFSMLYAYSMNLFTSRTAHRDKFLSDHRKYVLGKKMRRRVATTDDVLLLLLCFVDSELSQFGEKEEQKKANST